MSETHRGGWLRSCMGAVLLLGLAGPVEAQVDVSRLSPAQQARVANEMTTKRCTCGCELTVAACLIEDPTCDVSPKMAQAIVDEVAGAAAPVAGGASASPADGGGAGLVSDGGEWHQRLGGQQLVYIYTGTGYRTREQTYLCSDGTFLTNQEGGSVTSLGTAAFGDSSAGRWTIVGNTLTLASADGESVSYALSLVDGTLYLDNWRYFWTDNDRCP